MTGVGDTACQLSGEPRLSDDCRVKPIAASGQEDEPLSQESENSYHLTAGCGGLDGGTLLESVKSEGLPGEPLSRRRTNGWITQPPGTARLRGATPIQIGRAHV